MLHHFRNQLLAELSAPAVSVTSSAELDDSATETASTQAVLQAGKVRVANFLENLRQHYLQVNDQFPKSNCLESGD